MPEQGTQDLRRPDPLTAFRFLIRVGDSQQISAAFSRFSGVRMEVETIQTRDGDDNRGVKEYTPEPGDRLYLYTDGVTEATNSHEELFGDERLQNALNEYMDLPVEQFLPKIKECIDAFVGDADQFDDITMLALDYQSKGETEHD